MSMTAGARRVADGFKSAGGVGHGADLIERLLGLRCDDKTQRRNNFYIGNMSEPQEHDEPDYAAEDPKSSDTEPDDPDADVVPEAGEGPIPKIAGDPRPPIGN
jgi:hypothetical protein